MNRICTTIEQSQKLIELGIDTNTADMVYVDCEYLAIRDGVLEEGDIPAWSLTALFMLLPKETRLLRSATNDTYECDYSYAVSEWYDNPLDAVFEAVCKLCENINIK